MEHRGGGFPRDEERQVAGTGIANAIVLIAVAFVLVLASATIFQTDLHVYDTARFLELALLVIVLPCLILSRQTWFTAIDALGMRSGAWCLTTIAIACLSTVMAARWAPALDDVAVNVALALLGLAIYAAVRQGGKCGTADMLLVYLFPLVAFSILIRFAYELTTARLLGETFQWTSPFMSFANVRFFNQIQAYSLWLLTLPLLLRSPPQRLRWFFFLVAAGFWMLLVLVPSRSTWLALALTVLFALVIFPRRAVMKWLRPSLMALLAGVVGAYVLMEVLAVGAPGPGEVMAHVGRVADRVELWTAAASMIVAHPVLGVGPANFAFSHDSAFGHPHSLILQAAAEYGLPLAALLLLAGSRFLVHGVRAVRSDCGDTLDCALLAAIICGLIDAMFSGNNLMPHSQMVMAVLIGWFLGRTSQQARLRGDSALGDATGGIIRTLACVVWGALLWSAYSYYQFSVSADYVLTTAGPRFWFDSRSVYYGP